MKAGSKTEPAEAGVTVLLVDDHELFRSAVRLLLESSLGHLVFEAASAIDAVDIVESERIDVVLLDVRMPDHDGLWALARIREMAPDLPVLMLSHFDDGEYVHSALEEGAAGYVVKGASVHQLSEAIETALSGRGMYVHPVAAEHLLGHNHAPSHERLTEREVDVLRFVVEGATNEEIAARLFVTEKTVKTHLSAIFRKLGVTNRTQAATKAVREGLAAG
jgi:DNA-binding NarL/FixJ family response regulator